MKYYLRNLLTAICGKNPYQQELDKLKEQMVKAGENVSMLSDAYYGVQEKRVEAERLLADYAKQMNSYQTLVDNLRKRVTEKDAMIDEIRKDYQRKVANYEKRVGDYSATIADLQKKVDGLTDKENRHARGKDKKPKARQARQSVVKDTH